jgi:RHS repeat-associated protein
MNASPSRLALHKSAETGYPCGGVPRLGYEQDEPRRRSLACYAGPGTQLIASTSKRLNSTTNPATSWGYDALGNASTATPWKASYEVTGQMSRLDLGPTITQYGYDPDRRRVLKAVSLGAMTSFVYGPRGELLGEYDLASGEVIREYLWVLDTPVAMVGKAAGAPTAEIFAIHTDHLDTPRLLVDSLGRTRWSWLAEPYGNEAGNTQPTAGLAAVNQPLRMPGQYWDAESGLFYNHHRYYDPRVGRYVQSDPIGLDGGINNYAYVGGNPVSYVDDDGLKPRNAKPGGNAYNRRQWARHGPKKIKANSGGGAGPAYEAAAEMVEPNPEEDYRLRCVVWECGGSGTCTPGKRPNDFLPPARYVDDPPTGCKCAISSLGPIFNRPDTNTQDWADAWGKHRRSDGQLGRLLRGMR